MEPEDAKTVRAIVWAIACVLCTLIGSWNAYYAIRDYAAIKSGLEQSVSISNVESGGYWRKPMSE